MLVARKEENALLKETLLDDKSHFIAVYGRRRIGKTFLIRESFGYRFTFSHSGIYEEGLKGQLKAFSNSLEEYGYKPEKNPRDWLDAFSGLKELIKKSTEKKKVIFIDELSWMDTPKSHFLSALENFWNGWASARNDIVLIVCASATSWIISNIVHNKGGLYHRLTEEIYLQPFTLSECEEMIHANGLSFSRLQILQCYMILGGVPYYWGLLKKGLSLPQNIDEMFFAPTAALRDEYSYLFKSMFKNPSVHTKIIEALGKKKVGMTREEILETTGLTNSGDITIKLDELEKCGFIRSYTSFGSKKKNTLYQLIDCFTLFYFRFLQNRPSDEHFWQNTINTPKCNTWNGLAFERVCLIHANQLKKTLKIEGVQTEINSWYCNADDEKGIYGSQIDLLIARADMVINLCEMKYATEEYTIDKDVMTSITRKRNDLLKSASPKYAIYNTLVTPIGITDNKYSCEWQSIITLNDLFD